MGQLDVPVFYSMTRGFSDYMPGVGAQKSALGLGAL